MLYLDGLPAGLAQELETKADIVGALAKLQTVDTPAACTLRGTLRTLLLQPDPAIQDFARAEELVIRQAPSFEQAVQDYALKTSLGESLLFWGFEQRVERHLESLVPVSIERLEHYPVISACMRLHRRTQALMALRMGQLLFAEVLISDLLDVSEGTASETRADYVVFQAALHHAKREFVQCERALDEALELLSGATSLMQQLLVASNLLGANWFLRRAEESQRALEHLEATAALDGVRSIMMVRGAAVLRRSRKTGILSLN